MISEPSQYQNKIYFHADFYDSCLYFLRELSQLDQNDTLKYSAKSECGQFLYWWVTPVTLS